MLDDKLHKLEGLFHEMGSTLVAFSGGVDSAFLLAFATRVLGDRAVGMVGQSPSLPASELAEAREFAERVGARIEVVPTHEYERDGYRANEPDRCYHCKTELFSVCRTHADRLGLAWVCDGYNLDDGGDYRPGKRAAKERDVRHPLAEAGLTKNDIREASRRMDLPTWNKPAFACLASRIPYGTEVTVERLSRIEICEEALRREGFEGFRVRFHDKIARVELPEEQIARLVEPALRARVVNAIKAQGFAYVALDLQGYRSGSMNEVLSAEDRADGGMTERLRIVADIAKEGGALALAMRPSLDVSYKPDGSVVTNADMAVQELVVRRLRDAFPDAAIVAEENGLVENADAVFAVDPIDGTDSYQRGFPHFGISIGLVENGRCVLGVFFGPVLGELYAVDAGETPTLNGEPIRSRDRSGGTAPLLTPSHFHKMFVTDFPGKVRSYGSMAYHLAYVASGQARGAMAFDSHIWDLAAGVALLEAAGARLEGLNGEPFNALEYMRGENLATPMLAAAAEDWDTIRGSIRRR